MILRKLISHLTIEGRRTSWKFQKFIIWATVSYSLLGILPAMKYYPIASSTDILLFFLSWLFLALLSGLFISLLSLSKWVFAILFPVFFLGSVSIAFYIDKYNITLNSAVIESALYTNTFETISQLSFFLVAVIVITSGISVFLLVKRFHIREIRFQWISFIIVVAGLAMAALMSRQQVEKAFVYSPYSLYYGVKDALVDFGKLSDVRKNIDAGSFSRADTLTVVFVAGEAMRADHLSLNGYKKETFPEMAKRNPISFPHIYSEWSYTIRSLPHIFTRADSANHLPATTEKTFISIFNTSGYSSWWIGNQDLNKYLAPLANDCDTKKILPYSLDFTRYDGKMLPFIQKAINSPEDKKLIVVHQFGCHWWYPNNCPKEFQKFKPVLKSTSFVMADSLKIKNSYDNVAFYTDYFLSQITDMLKDKRAILIYLSDHGELLGENRKWMHAQQTIYEKNPACMIWFSDKYVKKYPEKVKMVLQNKDKHYRTDFLFHSILDAGDISSPVENKSLDIFNRSN